MPGPRGQHPTPKGLTSKIKVLKMRMRQATDDYGHHNKEWYQLKKTLSRYQKLAGGKKAPAVSPGKKPSSLSEGARGVVKLITSASKLPGKAKAGLEKVERASEAPGRSDALSRPGKGISKESYKRAFHPKKKK